VNVEVKYLINVLRFTGGEISHCYNCIDRHVDNGNGDQIAIIYDSPITNTIKKYSYREFQEQVCLKVLHSKAFWKNST